MTLAIILVCAAIVSLAVILKLALSRGLQISARSGEADRVRPIDLEAFRNLINPAEDEYLRRRLPPRQFRVVRRARLRAMGAYVRLAAQNAVIVFGVAQAALTAEDASTVAAAQQLAEQALLLRRNAAFLLLRIYIALAWPYSNFAAVRVAERYEQLGRSAMLLGRLQNPAVPVRLSGLP